jgi:hypothetical protein
MMIADLRPLDQSLRGSLPGEEMGGTEPAPPLSAEELFDCVRALGGWVAPDGLAPRAEFDRLVEQGRLEAWPGRALYRACAAGDGR